VHVHAPSRAPKFPKLRPLHVLRSFGKSLMTMWQLWRFIEQCEHVVAFVVREVGHMAFEVREVGHVAL